MPIGIMTSKGKSGNGLNRALLPKCRVCRMFYFSFMISYSIVLKFFK
jgi:hypothetical protein